MNPQDWAREGHLSLQTEGAMNDLDRILQDSTTQVFLSLAKHYMSGLFAQAWTTIMKCDG